MTSRTDADAPITNGGPVVVEEKLVLIKERDLDGAVEVALSMGVRTKNFGRRWLAGDPELLLQFGANPAHQVHPSLVDRYKVWRFLELEEVFRLKENPGYRVEIEVRRYGYA